ncbi:BnaA04g16980D [Brassica napus]|uniref:BnaA04g16980D protein n=4 Tax=Brassica TaxID=3705 RepID=A0A078H2L7_BRANA|nr:BnaA04g16980D [Brassica napus]
MVRCVRLWRGEWKKSVDQEWDFVTDPEDYGYRVLVSKSASFEAVDQLVRRRYSLGPRTPVVVSYRLPSWLLVPQGNKTPPLTINDTAQLSMVLNVRTWLDELALLVTIGAKGVAEYQFLCRTNFTVGATSYVFDESATDNSRAAYENRGAQMERVMNAIFPEEGMLLFHRVSLEMSFADNFLVNRNRRTPPPREIIELDDDDDEMGEGSQPTMRTAGEGGAANAPRGRNAQAEAPPIFWDVGMNVVDYTARRGSPLPTEARVENGMMFWEGLANEEEALAGETNVVMEAENLNVGVAVGVTDNIALANNVVTPTVEAVRVDDGGGSSTGSTDLILTTGRHQVKLPNNVQVGNEESPIIHGPSRELVAAQGLVLASTAVAGSGRTVSEATLPSMMKLAMCCAVKEGGTSRAVNRATETSSEGSTTDGGC